MKRLIFFALSLSFMASLKADGQSAKPNAPHEGHTKGNMHPASAPCNIDCCQKSFPYDFCNPADGSITTKCSTNPSGGGDGVPANSFIPSCVKVIGSMRTDGLIMPNSAPPQPANLVTDFKYGVDSVPSWCKEFAKTQLSIDSGRFDSGFFPIPPLDPHNPLISSFSVTTDPGLYPDSGNYITIVYPAYHIWDYAVTPYDSDPYYPDQNPQYVADSMTYDSELYVFHHAVSAWNNDQILFNCYLGASQQYTADSAAWIHNQNSYTQIWSDVQAQSDAYAALQTWLNVCTPPVQPSTDSDGQCCLDVILDQNSDHFTPSTAAATTVDNQNKSGFPKCGENTCPEQTRFIRINISNSALNQNLQSTVPDVSKYTLYTVHPTGFYTDPQFNPSVYDGFSVLSFYMTVEHEMGHFFGLHHPEGDVGKADYYSCYNCYTQNPFINITGYRNPSGYISVMAQYNTEVNTPTFNLSDDDKCQFQKLYCNPCGTDGVINDKGESVPNPEIFPNPTTGASELDYTVKNHAFVQVAIYDVLGNLVRSVSSNYEETGSHKISLGTESLPSGHYVCRVRVGESVTYLNVAIEK